jgi:hypothetical protein
MAPNCPEEVDVFTVPHSRMKELVHKYLVMVKCFVVLNIPLEFILLGDMYVNHENLLNIACRLFLVSYFNE